MGYLVLARKWRPQTFEDISGQESIIRILSNAIKQSRIAHAYLFSGPRGVGKTSTARILSKALNCVEGPTVSPCGKCDYCISIADGSSVDVIEIDGASNNSVDDVRDLREKVKYAPSGGRYKVYIIDEAHMLSQSAFNALLKTLEEPPSHIVFVLATTASNKIPITVLSRCQHLPFKRISPDIIKERLGFITGEEGIKISEGALDLLAKAADGSMRDSLTLLDQVAAFSDEIDENDLKALLGLSDSALLIDTVKAVLAGNREAVISLSGRIYEGGLDIRDFTKALISFLRDLLVCKVLNRIDGAADFNEEEKSGVEEILSMASEEHLILLLESMVAAENEIRMSGFAGVALEMSLIKASFLSKFKNIGEVISKLSGGAPTARLGERPASQPPQSAAVDEGVTESCELSPEISDGKDLWSTILKKINADSHVLACKLSHAHGELNDDILTIAFNGGFSVHAESVTAHKGLIEKIAQEAAARKIKVVVETRKKKESRHEDMREKILSDPFVQEALELFDGRIVDVKPRKANGKD